MAAVARGLCPGVLPSGVFFASDMLVFEGRKTVAETARVIVGDVEVYFEVANGGPVTVDADSGPLSFDGVRESIEAVAGELSKAWEHVRPDEAVVEFAVKATAKSGKLTALIVEGGGEAALSVKLTWKSGSAPTGDLANAQS